MKHKSFRQMGINTLIRLLLLLFALIVLYPMFWNIVSSFKTSTEFLGDPFALPGRLEWDNYARALEKSNLLLNFKNTFIVEIAALLTMADRAVFLARSSARWAHSSTVTSYFSAR